MSTTRPGPRWQAVGGLTDFSGFLLQLAQELERESEKSLEQGLKQQATPHGARSLNDFFWAWFRVLGDGLYRGGFLPLNADDVPGWRGLAFQVRAALTVRPSFNCVYADSDLTWQEVGTPQHLRQFLGMLSTDVARDRHLVSQHSLSRHSDLARFLEAWGRWLHDEYLRTHPWLDREIEPVTWQSIAIQLEAARGYE